MKIAIVMGTRPEIIKLSSIIKLLDKKNSTVIFTGQHYDYNMSMQFMDELKIRKPDYSMKLTKLQNTTTDRATQIGEIVLNLAKIISKISPDTVIVQGDTNTVLAAAITGIKCSVPVSHVEAGLRSYDWRMPEEHNRIAVDHISEFLFAPTEQAKKTLKNEKVHGQIHVTGNTSIDAIQQNISRAEKNANLSIEKKDEFALVTLHRGENVDDRKTLGSIVQALLQSKMDMIFPAHPRTVKQLERFGFYKKIKESENILVIPPVGYFDMLYLMKKCKFIISDSGGVQEEATSPSIRKKVLVVRKSTDRPEAVKAGYSELVGTSTQKIIQAIKSAQKNSKIASNTNPYGNGNSGKKILSILRRSL
ncbi:MAG: UDP-N-acetylglucosamine 2-epimerase (non-hydrolyzing) [Nitrososphaera sp.]|jgi:UDP-N-acetylglucosamine 2-epimerase (non-hydrolysing)